MAADPDHACVVADTGFGKYPSFRKELRARNEPYVLEVETSYVLEVETSKFVVVPEETTVLEPGSTSGRGRPWKHPAYPQEVDAATSEQIADRLEKQDDWREATWTKPPSTGSRGVL